MLLPNQHYRGLALFPPWRPRSRQPGDDVEWEGEHDDVAVLRDVVQSLQEPQLETQSS